MTNTTPFRDSDLERVRPCKVCGYPFVRFYENDRTLDQGSSLKLEKIVCPDCGRIYVRAEDEETHHFEGDPSVLLETLEAEEWRQKWRRPPRVLLDTVDDYGRHVWLRVSRNLVKVLERRPADALSILASQRPGAFDPESVRFICWHNDDFALGEYQIAELLLS